MVKNLKELRREKGISQHELASIIGTSQQSVNKYENHNIEPDIATLILLADYFETSVDYLIGRTSPSHMQETDNMSFEEAELIEKYRSLDKREKQCVIMVLDAFATK